ncbi:type I polyketide synthase [Kitasatospora sp. NPDC059327]|uniref:type I polyketide synthase n=1 Tax=Kitasatospora sp. NPDC059327 TaxID=3346803 RepID=UPI0036D183C2
MTHGSDTGVPLLYPLSGDTAGHLAARAELLHSTLVGRPELGAADVAAALAGRPATGRHRAALAATDRDDLLAQLAALAGGTVGTTGPAGAGTAPVPLTGTAGDGTVAFVFPGQGSQWPGMAVELLDRAPAFAARLDDCAQALEPFTGWSVRDVLRGTAGAPALDGAAVVQPALFAVTLALVALWESHGVRPAAVLGHSMGEISSAVVSGALDLEDAARVVAHWSRLQATLTGRGEMVSVMAPAERVRPLLERWHGRLTVAAVNGPGSVVVSGDAEAAADLVARSGELGVHARLVAVGLAAHSAHIDSILPELRAALAPLRPRPARLPFYSGLTGGRLADPVLDADHWCRNLRGTVRFAEAATALLADGHRLLLEVSPHPVLTSALQETARAAGLDARVRGSLRRGQGGPQRVRTALGELFVDGHAPDLAALAAEAGGRAVEPSWEADEAWRSAGPAADGQPEAAADGADGSVGLAHRLAGLAEERQRALLLDLVGGAVNEALGRGGPVHADHSFVALGLDSVSALATRNRIGAATGLNLPATLVFDRPTPRAVAEFLLAELTGADDDVRAAAAPVPADRDDPVVIVAMGCRFPGGVDSPERLWELVAAGGDAVGAFPSGRGWDLAAGYAPEGREPGRYYQREAGFLAGADLFDAGFFGISPREAEAMDPQQRLLLETSWEAFERAGIEPGSLRGSRTGVFVGAMAMDYGPDLTSGSEHSGHLLTGTAGSVASGRVSYVFGLEGPAVTVDTACSSSLVALHLAAQSLRRGECDLALAGGVTVMSTPGMFMEFSRQGGLAPDGRCKAFAAAADGFGLAEGAGVLVLERLSDARRGGHPVLAVLRGSAVNQDGASNGLTAPNGPSQQRVIGAALADAGLTADQVDAVEAHGTGTTLGDPIEAQALLATYGRQRPAEQPLLLGSLKSNIGHTQAAAGVAGVMKMVLAMRHGVLPRTLHVDDPTPHVDWSTGAVELLTEARDWRTQGGRPRRAGVSSFGVSGTNAHVVLEQAPEEQPAEPSNDRDTIVPWPLSARSPEALRDQADRLLTLDGNPADIAHSLATGRAVFDHRAVAVGTADGLRDALTALSGGSPDPRLLQGAPEPRGRTVFVFPGQGSQWPGMAAPLLDTEPVFAERIAQCEQALAPHVDWSLTELLREGEPLERVDIVQPALWAVMVSLAALWQHHGVHPDAVLGHSQGEIAAAVVAGALTLEDGARVSALRSRALHTIAGDGGMVSLALSAERTTELLAPWTDRISIAAHNSPTTTVVAGDNDALTQLLTTCEHDGVRARTIPVDYASHSPHVDRLRRRILTDLAGIEARAPRIPMYSTVTGDWLTTPPDTTYWYTNLRQPVLLTQALETLHETGHTHFVETSPHPVLTPAIENTLDTAVTLPTLRRDHGDRRRLLTSLAHAWTTGLTIDWTTTIPRGRRVELPTYPFQRERFWLAPRTTTPPDARPSADALWDVLERQEPAALSAELQVSPAALGEVLPALADWRAERAATAEADSWRYRIGWQPLGLKPAEAPAGRWLAVLPESGAADRVVEALAAVGLDVLPLTVTGPGAGREALAERVAEALGEGEAPAGVLSLLAHEERPHPEFADLPGAVALTLALVQALGDAGVGAPLWCLVSGTAVLGAGERPGGPVQGAVAGLARTVALEHPERWGGLVDLPPADGAGLDERAARRLCAVLAAPRDEEQVAVRSTGVHGRRLLAAPVRAAGDSGPGAAVWRPAGTVLVTGGTGAVGAQLARRLVAQGAERVVLLSRRGAAAPGAAALRAELGPAVEPLACDVTDRQRLAAVVAAYRPDAVVHAAGALDDGVLDALTPERMAFSLRAKLTAALLLEELTADLELSAFVVFSSVTGVVGNAGQGNYATANAALDALVARRRAAGLPGTAIAWGAWGTDGAERGTGGAGAGMLADEVARRLGERGLPTMSPRSAITAVARALGEDDELVVVADVDWRRLAESSGLRSALLGRLPVAAAAEPAEVRPAPVDRPGELAGRLAPLSPGERLHLLTDLVRAGAAAVLRHADSGAVLPARAFAELGFDSLTAVELRNRLGTATGLRLPATVLFDHPTPHAVAVRLLAELGLAREPAEPGTAGAAGGGAATGPAGDEPLALVGMACRFPGGVGSPQELWELLAEGRDAVGDWPADRGWDTERLFDPDPDRPGTTYSRSGAFLADAGGFDAEFFGVSPREALAMDPQQRLLLETAWQAVEDSGQDPSALRGGRVGVFVGTNGQDYVDALAGAEGISEGHLLTGNTASVLSGRISYALGLEGPALTVDTACSSSLVALHLAAQSLRRGECELALAGGVTVMSTPKLFVEFSRQRGLAPDGRCKAFSADADGTGWGEGVGVLVLERLSDAVARDHRVLAVIRGTAVNQDGASNGLTAPNGPSQQRVIQAALADAGLTADQVDAVEAHGTGTRLGDPIEAQALQAVYGRGRAADRPLLLGSVKSNLGHTQAAAGVAGVIKTVLALRHGLLPRSLHITEPNPHVDWSSGTVRLLTESVAWPDTGRPRRAGVSSFGISGTNAHVIVEQAPDRPVRAPLPARRAPLLLSARGPAALRARAEQLIGRLDGREEVDLAELGRALAVSRAGLEHRAAVHGADRTALREGLRALADGARSAAVTTGVVRAGGRTAFLLPGQGSQRAGAGAGLYRAEPVFADALDEVLAALDPHLDRPLREVMFAAPGSTEAGLLDRTRYTQPALFALQTALLRLLEHHGVRPDLLLGHSIGELSAAHAAGVLDLADASALVAARGRLMDELPEGGAMVAVEATEEELAAVPAVPGVDLAAVNGPRSCVLSGDRAAVLAVADEFRARGRRTKRLAVGTAFHSARLEPMLAAFREVAAGLAYRPPTLPVISDLTGGPAGAEQLCSPDYWVRHARGTVRFLDGVRRLRAEGADRFVELGAGGVLSALVQECLPDTPEGAAVALLREGRAEDESVTAALARLYVHGTAVDWSPGGTGAGRVELPGYPFQHRRFWPAPAVAAPATERLRYRIDWQPLEPEPAARLTGRWLLVLPEGADADGHAADAARALAARGAEVELLRTAYDTDRAALAGRLPAAVDGVLALPGTDVDLLVLVQALGDAGVTAPLWCATRGAVAAGGQPVGRPERARLWGLGRVAALEHPERWGGLVDLPAEPDDAAWEGLCAVLAGAGGDDQLAVRPSGLLSRRLRRSPVPAATAPSAGFATLRGTVLITGGTGGLGAHLARRLARTGTRRLVLTSRRGPAAPGAQRLAAELTALGTEVTVAACDVADRAALAALLDGLGEERVDAVVHAAGLTSDTPLARCTPEGWAAECAAKAAGAANLDALLEGRRIEAFVLFSSVSAAWGSAGQGAYAAANAQLDALAEHRRSRGLPATSVAWGPWAGAGMAEGPTGELLRALGLRPMAPATALDALEQALELDETHLVVADLDWTRFAALFESARRSPLLADLTAARTASADDGRGGDGGEDRGDGGPRNVPDAESSPGALLRAGLAPLGPEARQRLLVDLVRGESAAALGYADATAVDPERPFREVGFDSLTAVDLRNRLVTATGLELAVTTVFDHPTATALAEHLLSLLVDRPAGRAGGAVAATGGPLPVDEPLAVVGMACRFPGGVRSPEDLWRLVADGTDAVGGLPTDRGWPLDALYSGDPEAPGTFYATAGGFLHDAGEFDAAFFGISPREALAMDPQQRLLLETAWEAVERAGLDPAGLRGSGGGVFLGVAAQGYGAGPQDPAADVEGHLLSGTVTSVASGRIAYTLGLEGPAVTVETACSSSLVALHLAGQSLRARECSFALVGGAAVMASPDAFVEFSRQRGLAADGRCRSFSDEAGGTGWSEGVGVLLVETLAEARRLGHPVLAVVRGTAINQDGASNGLTAPNGPAQQRVIRQALANSGLSAAEVDAVEAHGTGTTLGDPIEAGALLATYGQGRPAGKPLWLGSLKSNIGHTQAASGVAGVIKSVLALRHAVLPRTLHAERPSTRVDWSAGSVELLTEARPWETEDGRPRRIAVSSFGMSGTNAHAVLEQAPEPAPAGAGDASGTTGGTGTDGTTGATGLPWLLSARDAAGLRRQAGRLLAAIDADPGLTATETARTLATGRAALPQRAALVGVDRDALRAELAALAEGLPSGGVFEGRAGAPGTVFVFPGQGSQWAGMAVELLDTAPVFAERMAQCEKALAPHVDWSLTGLLRAGDPLDRVEVVQPALWAVMVSLAALWRSYGVEPAAVVGHSQGEIAAAVVAGALSLEDGATVVALRSRVLRRLDGAGGMVSVSAALDRVTELLEPYGSELAVAAVNGPRAVVVAGVPERLVALLADCERAGVRARRIPVAYAAHSAQVAEVREELLAHLASVRPRPAEVPIFSAVTGGRIDGALLDSAYWYRNLREPVVFDTAVSALLTAGYELFVEVSPHPVLVAAVDGSAQAAGRPATAVPTLRRGEGGPDRLLRALAEAWTAGAPVAWRAERPLRPDRLPTYAFARERYWLPTPGRGGWAALAAGAAAAPAVPVGDPVAAGGTDGATDPAGDLALRLAPLDRAERHRVLVELVGAHAAAALGHASAAAVRPDRPFADLGFDSMLAVRFRNRLSAVTGVSLPPTAIFDHPSPAALAALLERGLRPPERGPAEAELDLLEKALASLDPAGPGGREIGSRLRELLRGWGERADRDPAEAEPPVTLAAATADELFDLLDNDFGMA